MRRARGFTLIEIVVALAVLAFAMGAVITGMARYAEQAGYLREKTLALWVAHNRLTEIELDPAWPAPGRSDGDVELGGVEWRWEAAIIETADPDVRRVDIQVRPAGRDEGESAALSSFIGRAGRS